MKRTFTGRLFVLSFCAVIAHNLSSRADAAPDQQAVHEADQQSVREADQQADHEAGQKAGHPPGCAQQIYHDVTDSGIPIYIVKEKLDAYRICVTPGQTVNLRFDSQIIDTDKPANWPVSVVRKRGSDRIALWVPGNLKPHQIANEVTFGTRDFDVVIHVTPAREGDEPTRGVIFKPADQVKLCEAVGERRAAHLINGLNDQINAMVREHEREMADLAMSHAEQVEVLTEQRDKYTRRQMLGEVHRRHATTPIDQPTCQGKGVIICGIEWTKLDTYGVLRLTAESRAGDIKVARVEVYDADGRYNHAGEVTIGDGEVEPARVAATGEGDKEEKIMGILPRNRKVPISVILDDPDSIGSAARVVLIGPAGVRPSIEIIPLQPPPPPPKPELTPRQKRARQVTVGISGSAGAFWISDGLGAGQLEATSFRGLGLRITKGFMEAIAVEVEIAGGSTGEAQFENMIFDGQQGELTRSASWGRVGFAGLLRFGDQTIPYLRLGIGVQGASLDSKFSAGSAPDSSFELGGIYSIGSGIDIRLGSSFVAGAVLSYQSGLKENVQTIHAGIHVGYGWDRPEE